MKKIVLVALLLGACAKPDVPPPAVEVRIQEVKVPVATRCVDPSSVPSEPAKVGGRLNGQAAHDLDLTAASAILLRQWGRELRALIQPCLKP